MSKQRRRYSAAYKFQVALEAAKGRKTVNQLASEFDLHPNQISQWKQTLLKSGEALFLAPSDRSQQDQAAQQAQLYEQIGRLKMELEWIKKNLPLEVEAKRALIEPDHPALSIRRQCELLGLNRASYYYQPAQETAENLCFMRLIDEQYMRTPFYGWPRMTAWLRRAGYTVNGKRVRRLMQLMGLQAIYPRPKTSRSSLEQRRYPYLLRGLAIVRPNQVWSADITYVPMPRGFMYLVAVIDWFSRYVLAWKLSNTLDGLFCVEALQEALQRGRPEIFNTDQGAQFTASGWIAILEANGIQISMDGRGRALDNVFVLGCGGV